MTPISELIRELIRAAVQVRTLSVSDRALLLGRASQAMRTQRRQIDLVAGNDDLAQSAVLDSDRMFKLVASLSDAEVSSRLREAASVLSAGEEILASQTQPNYGNADD